MRNLFARRNLWKIVSLGLSVALLVFILAQIELDHFLEMVRTVPAWALAGAVVTYILLNYFRTLRFRSFMPQPHPSIADLMPIVLYHNFLTRVLPFKTGEISYVILLNRHLKQPVSEGISSLLSARLFELALVILGGAFGLLTVADQPAESRWLTFAALIGFLIVYIIALYYSGAILRFVSRLYTRLFAAALVARAPRLEGRVEEKLEKFAGQFDRIHDTRQLVTACVLSACTYSQSVLFNIVLLRGLGIDHDLGVLMTMISIVMFVEAAPIAVSGYGVIEGGWAFGLVTFAGLELSQAAAVGFFLHTCQVIVAALVGTLGWFVLTRLKPARADLAQASAESVQV